MPVKHASWKPRISPAQVSFKVIPNTSNSSQRLSTTEIPSCKTAHLTGTIDHSWQYLRASTLFNSVLPVRYPLPKPHISPVLSVTHGSIKGLCPHPTQFCH